MSSGAMGAVLVVLFGVLGLVGVSAYIGRHRQRDSTPIDVDVEAES